MSQENEIERPPVVGTPPKYQITIPMWLEFPREIRAKFVETFKITRSEGSSIVKKGDDTVVTSDGHNHKDLSVVTIEAMQAFLVTDVADFHRLLEATVERFEGELEEIDVAAEAGEKPAGRSKKKAAAKAAA